MKKILGILFVLLLAAPAAFAQKFGYIDSEFILSKMPAYASAKQEADQFSANWQKEADGLFQEAEKLRKKFQAEEVLLTDEMKKKRLAEIEAKEKEARDFQKKVFGFEGLLFKKRAELIRPVQDNLFEAVEKVSKKKGLQIMFDKSGDLTMIYTNPVHDYTEFVLEELGLASPEKNTPGARPAGALKEDPSDLPSRAIEGIQDEENSEQKTPVRKAPAQNTKSKTKK
ncbi:OmpH family outer membrane protein [Adhaeribacter soli]|uniref:OmpH family outer membrane protein n=1 Tax=Adhaeribacter soli TaxID=2607655 RepID=A0A5N1ILE2_9BACT|nr:OmpH family outer membrane protein [Adhaeribacter soli]KAA9325454.1 OmpH family outer membrane protein [Adhaeribacter soli]